VDVDAYVTAHSGQWRRLEDLIQRRRRLRGPEVDELVALYQRAATHLSVVRSASGDPALTGRLSALVARARAAVTGAHTPAWRDASRFALVSFPAAAYRARWWWLGCALGSLVTAFLIGWWVARTPQVQASIAPPAQLRQLVQHQFRGYYSQYAASSFAARVWTNNAWVAALTLVSGVLLGIPAVLVLLENAANIGVDGGLMIGHGRGAEFFVLILPHGLLELSAVFLAAGAGLRLGWSIIDPGPRPRARALAEEGRTAVGIALGLVAVLLASGVIEAFVTPSPLPAWARIAIGVAAEAVFLTYVVVLGRRAVAGRNAAALAGSPAGGLAGDITEAPDFAPVSG
jgi:uncharacterized membrane protein SpoIIM required for sporulation